MSYNSKQAPQRRAYIRDLPDLRAQLSTMDARQRHDLLINDYMQFYGGAAAAQAAGGLQNLEDRRAGAQVVQSDVDALRAGHRFIRTPADDAAGGLPARLARKYYDRLFKEYAIADLSRFKESKLGLRWRTQAEVVAGKGHFTCGAKGCSATDGLASFEVNFAYVEQGQRKQALVKLRLCPDCGRKLNYGRAEAYPTTKPGRREPAALTGVKRRRSEPGFAEGEAKQWVAPPPGGQPMPLQQQLQQQALGNGTPGGPSQPPQQEQESVLSADPSVWESHKGGGKVAPDAAAAPEQELDDYLEAMFM